MPGKALCNFALCALSLLLFPIQSLAQADGLAAKVDAVFASYDKTDPPGCALGVIKNGKLAYTRGYGLANLEHNIPNGAEIVYDTGSTSEQFTVACTLLLAAQGKLTLDDDVCELIPELPQYQKPITIRNLLHHTSGVCNYLALFTLAGVNFDDTTTERAGAGVFSGERSLAGASHAWAGTPVRAAAEFLRRPRAPARRHRAVGRAGLRSSPDVESCG